MNYLIFEQLVNNLICYIRLITLISQKNYVLQSKYLNYLITIPSMKSVRPDEITIPLSNTYDIALHTIITEIRLCNVTNQYKYIKDAI